MSFKRQVSRIEKIVLGTVAGLGLLVTTSITPLNAAAIGGAETQGKGKFAIGVEGEYVTNSDLKKQQMSWMDNTEGIRFSGNANIDSKVKNLNRTMVNARYGILDNLDIYAKFGTSSFETNAKINGAGDWSQGDISGTGTFNGNARFKAKSGLVYGAGIKGTVGLPLDLIAGLDIQGLMHNNKYSASSSITYRDDATGDSLSAANSWNGKMSVRELQVAPFIAKKIGKLTPYAGVAYTKLSIEGKSDFGEKQKDKAGRNIGAFVGASYNINKRLSITAEGRFIDRTAIDLYGQIKF